MAVTRHSTFDKTVQTIADRNALGKRIDGMTVVVLDAIADVDAGSGKAIYRWDNSDSTWILVSKSTNETISFETEELLITNGQVAISHYPTDNKIWGIKVVNSSDTIIADLRLETLTVSNGIINLNTALYNGNKLRFTYAYGTITQQISSAINDAVDTKFSGLAGFSATNMQQEIDRIENGVGLDANGNYAAKGTTNYIKDAISVKDATEKLDAAIKTVSDSVGSIDVSTQINDVISPMFEKQGDDIIFKGNLVPVGDETLNIGSVDKKIKDLFISAHTIYLGDNTKLEGTTITVDAGANPTSVADAPTIVGSSLIAKPFTYNPGTGNVVVRPTIGFQDSVGNSYPISFDTVNNKFSFDALGNHGQGSVVAKNLELSGALTIPGYNITPTKITISNDMRVDGDINLGYDADSIIHLKGTTSVEAPITFKEGATLGDGNDNIIINAGLSNPVIITSSNFKVTADGKINGVDLSNINASESLTTLSLVSNTLKYKDENGTTTNIDMSPYLDNTTNTIVSGVLNGQNIIFTREDGTTFSLNVSALYDDTNIVSSVNGKIGAITLSKADISGLENVENTSDANKPVSIATQSALNLKLNTSSYTASDVLSKVKTLDGSGSGLDADLLDGLEASDLVQVSGSQTITGIKTFNNTINGSISGNAGTATKLANSKTIAGVSFDGSSNIDIPYSGLTGLPVLPVVPTTLSSFTNDSNYQNSIQVESAINTAISGKANSASTLQGYGIVDAYTKTVIDSMMLNKVDKVTGKGLSTEDYTTAEKTKLSGIAAGAQVNTVDSVNGKTGIITLTGADVGLGNVNNTSDADKPISTATQTALGAKASTVYVDSQDTVTLNSAKSYTDSAITTLKGLAPSTLDTLAELATQMQADETAASALVVTVGNKVDKVAGKQLSTEDYTTVEKTKLSGLSNYTLPIASTTTLGGVKAGTNITIDTNGVISASGGSSTVFTENDAIITSNVTITSGKNAIAAGPITIGASAVITVPNGSTLTIV